LHDETHYPDSFSFKPERFIIDGKINPSVKDPLTAAFGFGRRICPARFMAYSSVWITMASMLATFNMAKFINPDGSVIEPTQEYMGTTTV
jgi:cytochrome P450